MKVAKLLFSEGKWTRELNHEQLDYNEVQLVLGFGERKLLSENDVFESIQQKFPNAEIALCSSAGEIFCKDVYDDTVSVTALRFDNSEIKTTEICINDYKDSHEAGVALMKNLYREDLKWVFVLSDGSNVNGSELIKGINSEKRKEVLISGGLAGDGDRFEKTLVGLNKVPAPDNIAAIGFYGSSLMLSHASFGGWETFGIEKTVTKSSGNKLYEIDGKNALDIYKKYLGKYAEELPSSALLFPLSLKLKDNDETVVRTILSVNDRENYMVFAGDIPEGSKVRFMKANFDRLIDAATDAAQQCQDFHSANPKLAILISCVGRKLVLGNRISEEVDAVVDVLGNETAVMGFYSYGEFSPLKPFQNCELHNQTITITGINEIL
ncbi:MAG: histidine kinase [Chlorobi bacterium]|nr:histidine kinase [Chlorobiota bacterium]